MINVVLGAGQLEGVSPEALTADKSFFDIRGSRAPASRGGEMGSVISQNGVNFVRKGLDQSPQEITGDTSRGFLVQLHKGEL